MATQQIQHKQQAQQLRKVIDLVGRRRALIISCILLGITVGLGVYLKQPKQYSSTALLSYEKQKVNPSQMSPDVKEELNDIVSTLTQLVISRTSLEKIINDEGLYKLERETLPMEDVVEIMRRNITVSHSNKDKGDTFSVTFMGITPNSVVRVTNALSARFIEENVKYREERASDTSTYTKDELSMAKEMLDSKEAVMRDYKLKYYNEMADQRASNTERLIALQEQYQNRQNSIQDQERTRVLIRDQIALRKQVLESNIFNTSQRLSTNTPLPTETGRQQLNRLQAELKTTQGRYTDEHPKVKSLKKKIFQLEQSVPKETGGEPTTAKEEHRTSEQLDKTLLDFQAQLENIGHSVAKMNKEKEEIESQIKLYEKWISMAPVREAEWSALTREYGELKRHYDFLVGQNLQAGSALNLERKQKGSQFKVVDSAQIPRKPMKPDFLKVMGVALLVGCGVGGGLALGLEFLDTSFRDPVSLEETFGLEVLCSVPNFPFRHEIVKQRVWNIVSTLFFLTWGLIIIGAILYFWKNGRIILVFQ
ncbi:MAG: hypothetical protein HGA69_00115 [Desulfobulbaceae bacterium]|nr:hypothetical protein [Desulfobulbaceae bacterium]